MPGEGTIIVGAGQAGSHAAMAMRETGYADPILLIGDERELPHERPPLSKAMLTEAEEPPPSFFHPASRYRERGIEFACGVGVAAIDPGAQRITLQDGRVLPYAQLLLATGGRARRVTVPGGDAVLTLRTLDDARRLRPRLLPGARIVCIGAGVIGLEIASSARARGCAVTVLEYAAAPMTRSLPPEIAAWLVGLHRRAGVALVFGARVAAIAPDRVVCADGSTYPADAVIAGIGMERNTELAAAAGLALDGGIAVDEHGRTSAPDVFAAGDVAAFWVPRLGRRMRLESWRHAQDHGIAVGRAMAGSAAPYDEVPWFWSEQHGATLQVAGTAEDAAERVMRGDPAGASFSCWMLDGAGRVTGVIGINAPRDVRAGQGLIRSGASVDPTVLADLRVGAQLLPRRAVA